jgi:glycosyltransferase involved in cell wall biosynthesis
MRDAFRTWGHQADVYALELDRDLQGDGRPWSDWRPGGPSDVVILHYALPSPLTQALKDHRGRRVLLHHNITPPEFFVGYEPEMVHICALGRAELPTLAGHVDLGLADSEFNRQDLEAAGFRRTGVLPIHLEFDRYDEAPAPGLLRMLDDGRPNLLFVGRLAPNKRQDDVLRLAAYWKRFIEPGVRVVFVGKLPRRRAWFDALQSLMYEQGFTPWDVLFTGHVDHRELLAAYRAADVFVSMSEHEGFGVPLVEAMRLRVPILAYATTAVADTLGDAGVRFTSKPFDVMAEAAHRLVQDAALRESVLAGQDGRVRDFAPAAVEARLRAYVEAL